MGSAFPVERQIECGLPDIPAIEGDLIVSCVLCEIIPSPKLNPFAFPIPVPQSADFGCYPIATTVDFSTTGPSAFEADVTYDSPTQTGYCKPRIAFTVRIPSAAASCATIDTVYVFQSNTLLSGLPLVNGYQLVAGDKVLVMNQTTKTEQDVYIVSSGSWDRLPHEDVCELVATRSYPNGSDSLYLLDAVEPIQTGVTIKNYWRVV
jgi:hypothetical protein